ncbi:MAG: hypothetical protein KJ626_13565 [Verrucomicrobia bacterium]|nr:hypothetical protein [Verrucomicrobiota bacterium]
MESRTITDSVVPEKAVHIQLLGVDYIHVPAADGGDLYLTRFGLPLAQYLKLENWREAAWFDQNRERLQGTSTVYKVSTKPINGRSVSLVVKWCRVGEHVPLDTASFSKFTEAEFNSPYEEFSLLMEMREKADPGTVRTNRPLAIYVPAERLELWQTGRSKSKIARKTAKYSDVELDIYRQYIMIYEWIEGISADEAYVDLFPDPEARLQKLIEITEQTHADMRKQGYTVMDHKPAHIIVRQRDDGSLLRRRSGDLPYALVDFELLARTPDHEQRIRPDALSI